MRSFPVDASSSLNLELSPDGSRILINGLHESVHLVSATTGDELLTKPISGLRSAKFNRDGTKIIIDDGDKIRLLEGTPMTEPNQ